MRSTLLSLLTAATLVSPVALQAQQPVTATLTLDDAIAISRRNNPDYLNSVNNRRTASAALRSARGALLPQVNTSFSTEYQQGGQQIVSGSALGASSDITQSSYGIGVSYRLNAASFITPRVQRANRDAVEADIAGNGEILRNNVAQVYLSVLQAQARATLQDTLVAQAAQQVQLARVRTQVGAGTQLDVRRAEVALGQQQVAALKAHNDIEIEKLRLFQQMGVQQPPNVQLTSEFTVTPPSLSVEQVLDMARRDNPVLRSNQSREKVAALNVRRSQSEYTPTLSVQTGIGGYTYQYTNPDVLVGSARTGMARQQSACLREAETRTAAGLPNESAACVSQYTFTDQQAAQIRSANRQFPFNFTTSPKSISATLSFPLFDGFAREQRVQEAQAGRDDARYAVRAQELALTANVTGAYLTLVTAEKTVAIQEQNSAKARDELTLAQERYRVGAATFLDVSDARASFERAENDRINAIYDYHKAYAALESAVGRPIR
jgi:outer membrane protein